MARIKLLEVRMSETEYIETRELAKQLDLDMSKLVRMLIRKAKKKSQEIGELKPIPENIV